MPGCDFLLSLKRSFDVSVDWILTGEEVRQSEDINNVIDFDHIEAVKGFKDKPFAKEINVNLVKIEAADPSRFREIGGYIRGIASTIEDNKQDHIDRRQGQRRKKEDPGQIPEGNDRRSGNDRRKYNTGT